MIRFERISARLEKELFDGLHGGPGRRFMTVRDLAERFEISLTTAHKVLRCLKEAGLLIGDSTNPALISPKVARPHTGGAPRRLGLLLTNINNPFFSNLCRHIQRVAADRDYQVMTASSGYDFDRERRAVASFLEIGVEGLVVCPGLDDRCVDLYRDLVARKVPLAFVSRRLAGVEADFVVTHNFAGGALVAGHLLSMGHESFGYISFGSRLKQDMRLDGYRSALEEEGVELPDNRIVDDDGDDVASGYQAMGRLMDREDRPTAVFAFNDLLAIGALEYCREHGVAVPEQVGVAGFDNLPESRVTCPSLTTVDYPVQSMARLAVLGLLDTIQEPVDRPRSHVLLEPHLVVRQSSDPSAGRQTVIQDIAGRGTRPTGACHD